MLRLIPFCLGLFLILLPSTSRTDAKDMGIDDLLLPEFPSMNDRIGGNQPLVQKPNKEKNSDELLGPKDVFPFLPDNHRDSGTGKFNSF